MAWIQCPLDLVGSDRDDSDVRGRIPGKFVVDAGASREPLIAKFAKKSRKGILAWFLCDLCVRFDVFGRILRIRGHVRLHREIVEHIEVGVQVLILLQRLQVSHRCARLRRRL